MTYIEREALLKKIGEEYELDYGEVFVDPYRFYKLVDLVPAADVVPVVHAEWEKHYYTKDDTIFGQAKMCWYRCSKCRQPKGISESPYCPNCGAKMLEE